MCGKRAQNGARQAAQATTNGIDCCLEKGKTTITARLVAFLDQAGKEIFLVDRNPSNAVFAGRCGRPTDYAGKSNCCSRWKSMRICGVLIRERVCGNWIDLGGNSGGPHEAFHLSQRAAPSRQSVIHSKTAMCCTLTLRYDARHHALTGKPLGSMRETLSFLDFMRKGPTPKGLYFGQIQFGSTSVVA